MSFEKSLKVFCIDDEPDLIDVMRDIVTKAGFTPVTFTSPIAATEALQKDTSKVILIISDYMMPEFTGLELRAKCLDETKHIPFLIVSGKISREEALRAIDLKISRVLPKPIDEESLCKIIVTETTDIIKALKDDREMVDAFISDAEGLIEQMEGFLLSLEAQPGNIEIINQIFAIAHTIKGGSGFLQPATLHHFMHRFEDFLSPYKKSQSQVDGATIDTLLKGLDLIKILTGELKSGEHSAHNLEELCHIFVQAKAQTATTSGGRPAHDQPTGKAAALEVRNEIRVSMHLLDEFMELSGEITVLRNMINKLVRAIEKDVPANKDVQLLGELLEEMHKINSQMQDKIIDLRKVPLKSVLRPLPRALRDVATTLKKDIRLETMGDDIRVDNTIAEVLSNSLIHMVRNSADHGIESAEERSKRAKPTQGTIRIVASEEGENINISISDDGKGINHEIVKSKAIENGLITKDQAAQMSPSDIRSLIFESGFSTAAVVTDVSGRGVGMDMVMKAVSKIGGRIETESEVGHGSKFNLILPIPKSINIIGALLVKCAEHTYCIPQDDIYRLYTFNPEDLDKVIRHAQGSDFLHVDGHLYPLMNLRETLLGHSLQNGAYLLDPNNSSATEETRIVLVKVNQKVFGIVVDAILDMEEIVVKGLSRNLRSIGIFAGATFLGDGKVGLILHPKGLANMNHIMIPSDVAPDSIQPAELKSTNEKLTDTVLFNLRGPGHYGVDLEEIYRLEHLHGSEIQYSGNQPVIVYRGSPIPIIDLSVELDLDRPLLNLSEQSTLPILITRLNGESFVGLFVDKIVEIQPAPPYDTITQNGAGILGSALVGDQTVTMINTKIILSNAMARLGHSPGSDNSTRPLDLEATG
jgi:two-component system, chemotaxis family, sensor kinase CheA